MKKKSIFIASVLLIVIVVGLIAGTFFRQHTYGLQMLCNNATGLDQGGHVFCKGVKIGTIAGKRIEDDQVVVSLMIDSSVRIPRNSIFLVELASITGERRIDVELSEEKQSIEPFSKVKATENTGTNLDLKNMLRMDDEKLSKIKKILEADPEH